METTLEKRKKGLIKRFHTLLGAARLDDDGKMEILTAYGVTTSKDLSVKQLTEICNKMDDMLKGGKRSEMDALRKRVIAAGCAFMRANGQEASIDYVKACAGARRRRISTLCRRSGFGRRTSRLIISARHWKTRKQLLRRWFAEG